MNPVLTEYVSQSQLLAHLLEPDRDTLKGRFSHLALLNHGEREKKKKCWIPLQPRYHPPYKELFLRVGRHKKPAVSSTAFGRDL